MTRWLLIGDPEWAPLSAFADGLRLFGVECVWADHRSWTHLSHLSADAVAIYGLRAQGRDILEHFAKQQVPVVVIDHGYMKRVHTDRDFADGYFQIGMNRLGWVPPAAPADRFAALGVTVKARQPRPIRRALIMGQVGHDASHRRTPDELRACYEALAQELSHAGARVIAYRAHPLGQDVRPNLPMDDPRPLDDAIDAADLVVSLNSNAGLDAIIAGCPAVTLMASHYSALAYRWPVRLAAVRPPSVERVTAHLERLAYAQWTAAEMRAGLPHRFLQSLGVIP